MFGLFTSARGMPALSVAVLALCAVPSIVFASKVDLVETQMFDAKTSAPLGIVLGKAEMVDIPGDVADVLVADPTIVDVQAIQASRLYVVGTSVGDTNLMALDASGNIIKRMDIHVRYDVQAIQSLVEDLFPDEQVKVGSIHDQIVLTGSVSNPEAGAKISSIVANYISGVQGQGGAVDDLISNLLEVRGEQQVMLQVRIIEASRSILKELGIETNFNDIDDLAPAPVFGRLPPLNQGGPNNYANLASSVGLTTTPALAANFVRDTGVSGIGALGLFINALEEENLVNVLAEPNLTAVSGEQAGFLAGGEFPVPQGLDQTGNLVIEFREFGVSLNFRPVVLSGERISLQLNTEVSSLDFESAVVLSGVTVPGLDVRRAETTVEIPSGGSLMIAGLLQSETVNGMSGLPGIRKTPVLGDLVSSDSFQRDETELVVMVTPYLVEPFEQSDRFKQTPEHKENPLASAFAINIRRHYEFEDESLFDEDNRFGYLLD
jgi:pilus assembly protein CpaC